MDRMIEEILLTAKLLETNYDDPSLDAMDSRTVLSQSGEIKKIGSVQVEILKK